MPGVVKIITADDLGLDGRRALRLEPDRHTRQPRHPLLAEGRVRYHGEPVAMVIAADRYTARDAADAVLVDYDPLPAVIDARAALEAGAPRVHEEYDSTTSAAPSTHETEGFDEALRLRRARREVAEHEPAADADRDGDPRRASPTG